MHTPLPYLANGWADCVQTWCVASDPLDERLTQVRCGVHLHVRTCTPPSNDGASSPAPLVHRRSRRHTGFKIETCQNRCAPSYLWMKFAFGRRSHGSRMCKIGVLHTHRIFRVCDCTPCTPLSAAPVRAAAGSSPNRCRSNMSRCRSSLSCCRLTSELP